MDEIYKTKIIGLAKANAIFYFYKYRLNNPSLQALDICLYIALFRFALQQVVLQLIALHIDKYPKAMNIVVFRGALE